MSVPDTPRVPIRSRALLQQWVAEFFEQHALEVPHVKVAVQDGSDGSDTGMVIFRPTHAPVDLLMEPSGFDEPRWAMTITARDQDLRLSPHEVIGLGSEIAIAGSLCAFLQYRSLEWDRTSGMH